MLVVFYDGRSHQLSARASRGLANVLEDVVRLVAVTGAQLHKNRCAYLLEAKFYDFGMDCLAYCCCVNVCIAKVEAGGAKSNGAIL
jgi:hypothetical protein